VDVLLAASSLHLELSGRGSVTALIVSRADDVHVRSVNKALERRGAIAQLLDLSHFPGRLSLDMSFKDTGQSLCLSDAGAETIDFAALRRIWWRRPQAFGFAPAMRSGRALRFAHAESTMAFAGLYHSLDAHWMNSPSAQEIADQKPYQLSLARALGFRIPDTVITNDPARAKAFLDEHPGQVVQKQMVALRESWRETRRVDMGDLEHLASVRLAPVQFQTHVEAKADVRVIVVDRRIFPAMARLEGLRYRQDVRMNMDVQWTGYDLPAGIEDKMLVMLDRMALVYGAFDFRLTLEDELVFLEVNPAGQFLFVERDTGQPISDAVAAWLIGEDGPRDHRPHWSGPLA
jgi:glutathione synthase/RimK-type ligase-like ATP-grasp enzyme